jgi:hypothetical protein
MTIKQCAQKILEITGATGGIIYNVRRCWTASAGRASTSTRLPFNSSVKGAEEFDTSWNDLLECIASKSEALKKAG